MHPERLFTTESAEINFSNDKGKNFFTAENAENAEKRFSDQEVE